MQCALVESLIGESLEGPEQDKLRGNLIWVTRIENLFCSSILTDIWVNRQLATTKHPFEHVYQGIHEHRKRLFIYQIVHLCC